MSNNFQCIEDSEEAQEILDEKLLDELRSDYLHDNKEFYESSVNPED